MSDNGNQFSGAQDVSGPRPFDPRGAMQGFLVLDVAFRLFIWSASIALATAALTVIHLWPNSSVFGASLKVSCQWALALAAWVIIANISYVVLLVVLRMLVPTPKPAVYATDKTIDLTRSKDRQLLFACLVGLLTKARYQAPFPAFLVFNFASVPPLSWLMNRYFGPRSQSCFTTDPLILDPSFVEIGRNVVIGSNASIGGHIQMPGLVQIKKTVIEDDVLIGANTVIFGGVHVHRGAIIGAGSVVPPYSIVGPYEYWAGVPAKKVSDMRPHAPPGSTPKVRNDRPLVAASR